MQGIYKKSHANNAHYFNVWLEFATGSTSARAIQTQPLQGTRRHSCMFVIKSMRALKRHLHLVSSCSAL